jgi:hypothetical protein
MSRDSPLTFDLVDGELRRIGATGGAPEAHGSLCGLACFLGVQAGAVWVAGLVPAGAPPLAGERPETGVLGDLAAVTCAALSEGDMSFTLLLPPDEQPLALRAAGLAEWCAGFMHGLGEAAGHRAAGGALGGDVTQEIVADFGEITRVTLGEDESELEAETAYSELVEFVRVSVQLVFEELHPVRESLCGASVH